MRKDEAQDLIDSLDNDLDRVREKIKRIKHTTIENVSSRVDIEFACQKWFEDLSSQLQQFGIPDDVRKKYDALFTSLLQLSMRRNRRSTYLKTLNDILQALMDELYLPVAKYAGKSKVSEPLTAILEAATPEEASYLHEALGCASNGFRRASVVMGWNAAIHRIHKVIETLGFDEFNKKAAGIKNESQGRFKPFNKLLVANSISDLRKTVFDSDLLWLLEYWRLIDSNQHDRLQVCFIMRSNSAHPGEALISEENLASFYSDLRSMVFANPNFAIREPNSLKGTPSERQTQRAKPRLQTSVPP